MELNRAKQCPLRISSGWIIGLAAWAVVFIGIVDAHSQASPSQADLSNLSLESLTSMEITSVSRKTQKLAEAAAAVFVITSEDIRRSGLSTVAELLRTVPGLDVAQLDANKWAITIRGFNERYSDRTLFLLDGRALHSPLTSGVNWDSQDTLLEDVERIEIIRGPGATLWGANAMDGVVNIITKKAAATRGLLIEGQTSIRDLNRIAARYGSNIGTNGTYRVFGRWMQRPGSHLTYGELAPDFWNDLRAGFRTDWDFTEATLLTIQGDIYLAHTGAMTTGIISLANPLGDHFADSSRNSGGNVNVHWARTGTRLDTQVRAYFDSANRNEVSTIGEFRRTFDLELNQHYRSGSRQDFSWGTNFRYTAVDTTGSFSLTFTPANRGLQLYGTYLQDEIAIVPNKLVLVLGSKLEHNDYTGYALQPSAQATWTPDHHVSAWASISRAAATPSQSDTDLRFNAALLTSPSGDLTLFSHFGTSPLPAETVLASQFGTRLAPNPKVSVDIATFYNRYSNIHTNEPGTPFMEANYSGLPTHLVMPDYLSSKDQGASRGAEVLVDTNPLNFWKLSASYTAMLIVVTQSPSSRDSDSPAGTEGSTPRNQFQIHSLLDLPRKLELDASLYYVGKLASQGVDPYTRLDLRAGWRPSPTLEFSVGGRNLLQAHHAEFGSSELVEAQPVERSAFVKAVWSF